MTLPRGEFEEVAHVSDFEIPHASDEAIHALALANGWIGVTKDDDFVAIALTDGPPTKVVQLWIGNGPKAVARDTLLRYRLQIEAFVGDLERCVLILQG